MSQIWQSRTALLIGEEALDILNITTVAIAGLGGVGSYAAEALVRAGIGRFILIDFDVLGETNLNRQIIATRDAIGQPKTEVLKSRILSINPSAVVITHQEFLDETNRAILLKDAHYLIDAIDSLGPKIGLLEDAILSQLKVISVMGAGNRLDPSKIHIDKLNQSYNCPMARRIRKFLRRRGVSPDIPCVYSSELPIKPEEETDSSPVELILTRGIQRNTIGSISYMPAMMGMMAASWVIRQVLSSDK